MFCNIFLVAIGGAIGSVMRFFTTELFIRSYKHFGLFIGKFPIGTFVVNILGSALAGVAYYFFIKNFNEQSTHMKNFILVGFLGGFTTFSAFSLDFFRLINSGNYFIAFVYCLLTVVFSIALLFLTFYYTKVIFP